VEGSDGIRVAKGAKYAKDGTRLSLELQGYTRSIRFNVPRSSLLKISRQSVSKQGSRTMISPSSSVHTKTLAAPDW